MNPYQNPYQQPTLYAQQQPLGPQMPMQWQQMPGDDQQQGGGMDGLAQLLQRFKKPMGAASPGIANGTGFSLPGGGGGGLHEALHGG